jgi:hypothetical protein
MEIFEFLSLSTTAVEDIEDQIINQLEELNIELTYSMIDVLEILKKKGDWEFLTDSLIEVVCETAKKLVLEKFPNAEIEYDVAGYCSEFEILNIDELDIKEE